MAALALPAASATNSPRKGEKKRKRKQAAKEKDKDLDSDAELEVSAEDLIAADGEGGAARTQGDADGEGDDEDEEEAPPTAGQVAVDVKQKAKRRRDETLLLRGQLDDEQGKRFDAFRSVVIPKAVVKKLNRDLYDQHIPNNLTAVVAGMVKIFVADAVEAAREIQPQTQHPEGPLQPYHLQMARTKLQEQGLLAAPTGANGITRSSTGLRPRKRMFRR